MDETTSRFVTENGANGGQKSLTSPVTSRDTIPHMADEKPWYAPGHLDSPAGDRVDATADEHMSDDELIARTEELLAKAEQRR